MRAYELARQIGVTSKELLAKAKELGVPVTNQLKGVAEVGFRSGTAGSCASAS